MSHEHLGLVRLAGEDQWHSGPQEGVMVADDPLR